MTNLDEYMELVEKNAPRPKTPHHPTGAECETFRKYCVTTCTGDCELCKVVPLYEMDWSINSRIAMSSATKLIQEKRMMEGAEQNRQVV